MWQLVEIFMGNASVVDWGLTYTDCQMAIIRETYIADGMALFVCEVTI